MTAHLERDLALLKDRILSLGGLVEQALERGARALMEGRADLAHRVLAEDALIDAQELVVEDDCLKLLALHQPVAGDLRFITVTMKLNNDLERIGDLAKNVAERALDLLAQPPLDEALHFERMTVAARAMLRDSLDALVRRDSSLARDVVARDVEVDDLNRRHFEVLLERMQRDPACVPMALDYLTSSLHFERIADLATNIAEDVVFLVDAEVIRHQKARASAARAGA